MSVLLLVTIIILVAATMAGVFTMNMNITQRVSNGDLALAEAEAGISEVLYIITKEDADTPAGNSGGSPTLDAEDDPKIDFGLNGETLRSTITPKMTPDEAYHVVTFDSSSFFPYSTNNTTLTNDSGSLSRTIPDGKFHIVSTGYCKGQYRTVECVIEKPPFPFGLATSGPINSSTPLTVKGVSSLANLQNGDIDRPGHILCNSPGGVTIQQVSPPRPTEISGFVKSAGSANIAQPAEVRGGVRTNADISTIADINIQQFKNGGQPGVVTLLDDSYSEAQDMDIMYFFTGNHLTYESRVNLDQAMLYVEGDLTIRGPVTGEGLIVVDGNATFESGTALSGNNKMAVLASGDITIKGNSNFFSGLVYSEGNLNASNVTIVGNTIINSNNPSDGRAQLDNVTVISNEETADMTITVTSSSGAQQQTGPSRFPFPLQFQPNDPTNPTGGGYIGIPPGTIDGSGLAGWPTLDLGVAGLEDMINDIWDIATTSVDDPDASRGPIAFGQGFPPPGTGDLISAMTEVATLANSAQTQQIKKDNAKFERDKLDADDPARDDFQDDMDEAQDEIDAIKLLFDVAVQSAAQAAFDDAQTRAEPGGGFADESIPMDITQEHRFNLNEYLPESERVKVSFWRVYPRRM